MKEREKIHLLDLCNEAFLSDDTAVLARLSEKEFHALAGSIFTQLRRFIADGKRVEIPGFGVFKAKVRYNEKRVLFEQQFEVKRTYEHIKDKRQPRSEELPGDRPAGTGDDPS